MKKDPHRSQIVKYHPTTFVTTEFLVTTSFHGVWTIPRLTIGSAHSLLLLHPSMPPPIPSPLPFVCSSASFHSDGPCAPPRGSSSHRSTCLRAPRVTVFIFSSRLQDPLPLPLVLTTLSSLLSLRIPPRSHHHEITLVREFRLLGPGLTLALEAYFWPPRPDSFLTNHAL